MEGAQKENMIQSGLKIHLFVGFLKVINSEIIALINFVAVTTYPPRPNNISAASMGYLQGFLGRGEGSP